MQSPPESNGGRPRPRSRGSRPVSPGLPVGRFFGVPIFFSPSWLIIAALITFSYGPLVFDSVNDISRARSYSVALGYAVLLALSVLAHELGHTAVSLALGQPVRRIVIFLLGGISELTEEVHRARDEFLVALAGPAVSLALAGLCWVGYDQTQPHTVWRVMLSLLLISNLVVAVFNLLPGLPLDGGRVLRATVWAISRSQHTGTRVAAFAGRAIAVALFVLTTGLAAHYDAVVTGIFGALLAAFIWTGAGQSLQVTRVLERAANLDLQRLMRPGTIVHSDVSVAEALRRVWQSGSGGLLVVDRADRPIAIVDERQVQAIPPERRPWTSVADVSHALEPGLVLRSDLDGQALVDAIRAHPAPEYLVVDAAGNPAGIVSGADVARAITVSAARPAH